MTTDTIRSFLNRFLNNEYRTVLANHCYDVYDKAFFYAEELRRIEQYVNNPTEKSSFQEIDDALYLHESPYYRYCASGAGSDLSRSKVWVAERQRLTALWYMKHPYPTPKNNQKKTYRLTLWQRIFA